MYSGKTERYRRKKRCRITPIEKKINDAITKVRFKVVRYEFVFDASSPALVYKVGTDATPAVKKN